MKRKCPAREGQGGAVEIWLYDAPFAAIRVTMKHIQGLDGIRFVCAAIVAINHFSADYRADLRFLGPAVARAANAGINLMFNGPAAVIVFFILSGFVIHLPYHRGKPFVAREYFARRYLRLLLPLAAATALYYVLDRFPAYGEWKYWILWSLVCELIYYTFYPLLLWLRLSTGAALAASIAVFLVVALTHVAELRLSTSYIILYGWTPAIALPSWLAGCWLAENFDRLPVISPRSIWKLRWGMFAGAAALLIVRHFAELFGAFSSNIVLLGLATIPATLWLGFEVQHSLAHPTAVAPLADRLGKASYSLYLVHPLILFGFVPPLRDAANMAQYLALVAFGTTAFYLLAERPSHMLAQRAGRWMLRNAEFEGA